MFEGVLIAMMMLTGGNAAGVVPANIPSATHHALPADVPAHVKDGARATLHRTDRNTIIIDYGARNRRSPGI